MCRANELADPAQIPPPSVVELAFRAPAVVVGPPFGDASNAFPPSLSLGHFLDECDICSWGHVSRPMVSSFEELGRGSWRWLLWFQREAPLCACEASWGGLCRVAGVGAFPELARFSISCMVALGNVHALGLAEILSAWRSCRSPQVALVNAWCLVRWAGGMPFLEGGGHH